FRGWAWSMAALLALIMLLLVFELAQGALPTLREFGWGFLSSSSWDPVADRYGAWPAIFGTVTSSILALAVAGPLGLLAAIFLAEIAPRWLESPLSFLIELLASVPSVVYGLWGLYVMVPAMRDPIQIWLNTRFGALPFFACRPLGIGMMSAVAILAIMILPYGISVGRDVLRAVPNDQREAMLALGATRWETIWKVVVPHARSGIVGGLLLALGRAVGETMAVTMLIGNRSQVSSCLFSPAYTLSSQIANEFAEAVSPMHISALMELGLVLFAITLLLNGAARLLVWRLTRSMASRG
ncbi:MAG: phosphate ABC transporter permease subunit PstC, partial [Chloroflexi bacterium]|nr:phosphate ABC transporter permease subunit PstC [Chloroflexota bacterium]